MSVETLRAVNGIGAKSKLREGHTLLVPAQRPTPQAEAALGDAVFTTVPQGRTFYYRVQRGDTLPAIAGRYGVTVQDVRGWNALATTSVKAGQQLRITSDQAPNAKVAKRASGKAVVATRGKAAPAAKSASKNGRTTAKVAAPHAPGGSVTASARFEARSTLADPTARRSDGRAVTAAARGRRTRVSRRRQPRSRFPK